MIIPVILCGGSGSRLWPLSRSLLPKQFLRLVSDLSMLQETVLRLSDLREASAPILVCNEEHRFIAAEQVRESGITPALHLLEPVGRNTAPAVAAAALAAMALDSEAVLLVLPADHRIENTDRFAELARFACKVADGGRLVTFGIRPGSAATGYGYIRRGAPVAGYEGSYEVAEFVEKPDGERAKRYLESGEYFWNSGMFAFRADRYIEELGKYRPDILSSVRVATGNATRDLDFVRLDRAAFEGCPADSIDYAIMERTQAACVVEAEIGWDDIGSWAALRAISDKDGADNALRGDVHLTESSGCYVRSESRLVVGVGVRNLFIVETPDAVLVADRALDQEVRKVVEHLRTTGRTEHHSHRRVYRPWGYFEGLDRGERFQAKHLMIKVGAKISLQRHRQRAEHWVVVSGTARVIRGSDVIELSADQSTYIPQGFIHRIENIGSVPLHVIEVQSGDYLGEDDIERLEDDYRRM